MHCPRCGQQQVSEEIKFCSRCGLPLAVVAEVLAHDGFLPRLDDLQNDKKRLTRNVGLKIALLWFVIFSMLLPSLAAVTKAPGDIVAGLAVFGFIGGVLISLLSFLFLTNNPKPTVQNQLRYQPQNLNAAQTTALPPQNFQPVSDYVSPSVESWKAPNTGELAPHSVTDETTKLLYKDK